MWFNIEYNDMDILCRYYIVIINLLLRTGTGMSVHNRPHRHLPQQVTGILPIANTGSPLWFNIEYNDMDILCRYYTVIINILLRMSVHNG